ncbi:MAG TPA: hypothetical protein PKV72_04310 [Candidatus Peribacteria bacterium]|nr:hypothetical protein [Candidatus Peribacteria bacterium]
MSETPHEFRVETGSRFSWDAGYDEIRLRHAVMAFLLEHDMVPAAVEGVHGEVLGDEYVFGDMVLRLTEEQAGRVRVFLADAAADLAPYEERGRDVVQAEEDDLRE